LIDAPVTVIVFDYFLKEEPGSSFFSLVVHPLHPGDILDLAARRDV